MIPGDLTRLEATERAALVTVVSYSVNLDLAGDGDSFRSSTTVRFSARAGAATFIDLLARGIASITLNGAELDVASHYDGARISLPRLRDDNELTVVAAMDYSSTGEGLHRFVDPADGETYLYSQFQVSDARRVFAVFEQPDLKATFAFTVTAPGHWVVISNQPEASVSPAATGPAGSRTWVFPPTPRISSYIAAVIAGPYESWRGEVAARSERTIPLRVLSRRSTAAFADEAHMLQLAADGIVFFEELFDTAFPFEKYDQIFVPEFNAGAMENAGAVTIADRHQFRAAAPDTARERRVVTVLHELAHMWFGDLVTMQWWDGLWLNEAFAEWASTLATGRITEWTDVWTTFQAQEKTWAYAEDQRPTTHAVATPVACLTDVESNFDGITYAKGASVITQLVSLVGEQAFLTGVAAYFEAHAWHNTTFDDLLGALESASGRPLREWAANWLTTPGVNTLHLDIESDDAGIVTSCVIRQTAPEAFSTLRQHRVAIGSYELHGDSPTARLVRAGITEVEVTGEATLVPALVGRPRPALALLGERDLSYARVRLDTASLAVALEHHPSIDDALSRAVIWGMLWDMTRDAELTAAQYVAAVIGGIERETHSGTRQTLLENAHAAASDLAPRTERAQLKRTLADALWRLTERAAPASDAQLQVATAFFEIAESGSRLAECEALYRGTLTMLGLELTQDLRWRALTALAAAGRAGAAEIEGELTRDATVTGQEQAARARAAMPGDAAKQSAWLLCTEPGKASAALVDATIAGFWRAEHPAELEPFSDRYFDVIEGVWQREGFALAMRIIVGLFPAACDAQEAAVRAKLWDAAHPEAPAALRRLLRERIDEAERAAAPDEVPDEVSEAEPAVSEPEALQEDAPLDPEQITEEAAAPAAADTQAAAGTALAMLDTLAVKGRAPKTGYDHKAKYGTPWTDVDRNGCDTRNDILQRDLTAITLSGPCKVMAGTLADPYTGATIDFVRGNTTSTAVQIDHVVALSDSWQKGAQQLSQEQRVALANDPLNLYAVDGPTNSRKSDGDAATWLPPSKAFRCEYVARQISVKTAYSLWVTVAEKRAMATVLERCPDQQAYNSSLAPAPVTVPTPAPAPAPKPNPAPAPAPVPLVDVYYKNCTAAREAGGAPVYAGGPGYGRHLDRDGDGVGCE